MLAFSNFYLFKKQDFYKQKNHFQLWNKIFYFDWSKIRPPPPQPKVQKSLLWKKIATIKNFKNHSFICKKQKKIISYDKQENPL